MRKLTIIIPSLNEARSLPSVITGLVRSLDGIDYKILIVDDGEDNTPQILVQIMCPRVELFRRSGDERNGLSGAVIAGFKRADSEYVAVMDGDGQHPPELIRRMMWMAQYHGNDMVLASRHIKGASADGLEGAMRKFYSSFLRQMPRLLFSRLWYVTDPLSGFFLIRTNCFRPEDLRAIGWKISLEVLLFSDINSYQEVGYCFRKRIGGESKANFRVGIEYFRQLLSLAFRYYFSSSQNRSKKQLSQSK